MGKTRRLRRRLAIKNLPSRQQPTRKRNRPPKPSLRRKQNPANPRVSLHMVKPKRNSSISPFSKCAFYIWQLSVWKKNSNHKRFWFDMIRLYLTGTVGFVGGFLVSGTTTSTCFPRHRSSKVQSCWWHLAWSHPGRDVEVESGTAGYFEWNECCWDQATAVLDMGVGDKCSVVHLLFKFCHPNIVGIHHQEVRDSELKNSSSV